MDFGAQRTGGCFVLGDPGKCSIPFGVEQTAEFYSAVISTVFNSYVKNSAYV